MGRFELFREPRQRMTVLPIETFHCGGVVGQIDGIVVLFERTGFREETEVPRTRGLLLRVLDLGLFDKALENAIESAIGEVIGKIDQLPDIFQSVEKSDEGASNFLVGREREVPDRLIPIAENFSEGSGRGVFPIEEFFEIFVFLSQRKLRIHAIDEVCSVAEIAFAFRSVVRLAPQVSVFVELVL